MALEPAREIYGDPQAIERTVSLFPASSNDNGMHQVVAGLVVVVLSET